MNIICERRNIAAREYRGTAVITLLGGAIILDPSSDGDIAKWEDLCGQLSDVLMEVNGWLDERRREIAEDERIANADRERQEIAERERMAAGR